MTADAVARQPEANVIVKTTFSVYEVDREQCRIRRLVSDHEPTPRQGPDGQWRSYEDLRYMADGMFIIWGHTYSGIAQGTLTSPILEINGVPAQ
jgi:hypothetical protein